MTITHKINMDLTRREINPRIHAVQGDALTRKVEISLFCNGLPWQIPGTPRVLIRYRRPDRTVGAYDTLAGGAPAYHLQENIITIAIAPDALALPGDVSLIVSLVSEEQVLSIFEITLEVQPNNSTGKPSEGTGSFISGMIPGPKNAQEGQILAVDKLTAMGTVQSLKAIDLPYYNSVQSISPDAEASGESETVYRVTMSDGTQHSFTVKNGSDGARGKSAYEYAHDGGYTKSEVEFSSKLADETPPAFYVTITEGESEDDATTVYPITADAGCEEIRGAQESGHSVYADSSFGILPLSGIDHENQQAVFTMMISSLECDNTVVFLTIKIGADGTGTAAMEAARIPDVLPCPGSLSINGQLYDGAETVDFTQNIYDMIDDRIPTVPAALPNPNKLILTGAVSAEYDGSGTVTVEIPAGGGVEAETETVLSDNLLDKSLLTKGQVFYYGGSGYTLTASTYSHYGFIPLRGAGTYRTKFQQSVHSSTGTRIALVNDSNAWVANVTGTCGEVVEDKNWVDFEFVVTESHIAAGATKVAFDVYELYMGKTMIVKDREYPSEYIPYGYIEVATDSGKKQDNVLCGKTAVFLGDSICAGTTVGTDSPYYNYGWAGLIGEANHMNWTNYGKNGGTIIHRGSDATCISSIADTAIAEHPTADYVIFEGGCNDADQMREAGLGVISSDYATFDTTTFSGALEALILKLVTAYPHAKIGYIIPQKMYKGYADYTAKNHIHRLYFDRAVEICQKWGISMVDIWNGSMLNPKLSTSSVYYVEENGQHLTEAGYLAITPMIESWMRNMYMPGVVGGGSGGVSSWNDLTDKPFDIVELMPETQFAYDDSMGYFVAQTDFEFAAGRTYIIGWNGVEYAATAKAGIYNEMLVIYVGNEAFWGGEDNGLPFIVARMLYDPTAKGLLAAIPMDDATSVSVNVKSVESSALYQHMDSCEPLVLDIRVDPEAGGLVAYATKEQIFNAYTAGRQITALLYDTIDSTITNLLQIIVWKIERDAERIMLCSRNYALDSITLQYNGDGTYTAQ